MPILTTMGIFITYPWLAAVLGVALLALGARPGSRGATVAGVVWLVYAPPR